MPWQFKCNLGVGATKEGGNRILIQSYLIGTSAWEESFDRYNSPKHYYVNPGDTVLVIAC